MLNEKQQPTDKIETTNGQSSVPVSPQWIFTYYKAVSMSWKDAEFKSALLKNANGILREQFNFNVPSNITVEFQEVKDNDFSQFPLKSVSVFDTDQKSPILFKVPLPPAPAPMTNQLDHITSFSGEDNTLRCCCFCC